MIVRRFGVWSVARMYGTLSAVGGLLAGLLLAAMTLVGAGLAGRDEEVPAFIGTALGVGAVIFLPIFYGVLGLVVGAIGAAVYNLFAGIVGGVEIDVQ
jgi:hypothetical protein